MTAAAQAVAAAGLRVVRFEFGYMARRRTQGGRKPPPRAETQVPEYRAAIAALAVDGPLIIGGKSMDGRVASLVADELHATGVVAGLLCLGYPFHPSGKPAQLRTAQLPGLQTPTLICEGTRDALGTREEVEGYTLSKRIEILWLVDGDRDLKPRKRVTGLTPADHLQTVGEAVAGWARRIVRLRRQHGRVLEFDDKIGRGPIMAALDE